jgi:hypothetical protein
VGAGAAVGGRVPAAEGGAGGEGRAGKVCVQAGEADVSGRMGER